MDGIKELIEDHHENKDIIGDAKMVIVSVVCPLDTSLVLLSGITDYLAGYIPEDSKMFLDVKYDEQLTTEANIMLIMVKA